MGNAADPPRPGRPADLEVTVSGGDNGAVVRCAGELDLATCRLLEEALDGLGASDVTIDATGLQFIDSTGIRLLLRAGSRLDRAGVEWRILPGNVLLRVAAILGVHDALRLGDKKPPRV